MSTVLTRLTFGIVPIASDEDTRALLGDFCAELGREMGCTILPHRAPSPAALASALHAGRVHVAWVSPTLLVTSRHMTSVIPVASSIREGNTFFHAALFVAESSSIRTPEDLRGKRAAWVAPTSAAGYLLPRVKLAQRGLDPRTLFASEVFLESHGAVASAVLEGRADAGGTFAVFENGDPQAPLLRAGFTEVGGSEGARVIDVAGPIPADAIVTSADVPMAVRARLGVALHGIAAHEPARRQVRALFGADGFAPFSQASVHTLKALVQAARDQGLME